MSNFDNWNEVQDRVDGFNGILEILHEERESLWARAAEIAKTEESLIEEAKAMGLGFNRSTWMVTDPKDWEANLPADFPAEDI